MKNHLAPRQIDQVAMQTRVDPVRSYLDQQSTQAIGDMGANIGRAGVSAGLGVGAASATGPLGPVVGALLAAGFTADAISDLLRSNDMASASNAFGRTGMPGAPTGPAMPLEPPSFHGDANVGRFADPRLMQR